MANGRPERGGGGGGGLNGFAAEAEIPLEVTNTIHDEFGRLGGEEQEGRLPRHRGAQRGAEAELPFEHETRNAADGTGAGDRKGGSGLIDRQGQAAVGDCHAGAIGRIATGEGDARSSEGGGAIVFKREIEIATDLGAKSTKINNNIIEGQLRNAGVPNRESRGRT